MNLNSLKNKVVRNLPTILTVTAVGVVVTATFISIRKSIVANEAFVSEINQKLADGTATLVQETDGSINVFW